MGDAKREVWVVEYKGVPQGNDKYQADECRLENFGEDPRAVSVKYVPAESPQPKAQGDGWVRCEERMPGNVQTVLVCHSDGRRELAWRSAFGWYGHRDALLTDITHWHALPAPPGGDQ